MNFVATALSGVTIVEPDVFPDERGFFLETWRADKYARGGIEARFVQDNHSRSACGTIRALHAQRARSQGKLVRVIAGTILDVVADIRRGSPTWLKWIAVELSAGNFRQIYVPPGFAHGICITSEFAEVEYKCTDYYDPDDELRIAWNDREIGVQWPVREPILSPKDRAAPPLAAQLDLLPIWPGEPR
ncbi:MAG TPA: dTDP-4-dehydrorhamnose 3,5-epimerase [Candidatus Binataceae bacterium]|nr:dTDP-4-dehydrorhamnose 3,5-epimerase [Candidatus Binataceae bacterium]